MSEDTRIQVKKKGRPKKDKGVYNDKTASEYLDMCKMGKSLTEIAAFFEITEDTLKKWAVDSRKHTKLHTVWELGKTFFKAFHISRLNQMIEATPRASASEIAAQERRMAVWFKEWNLVSKTQNENKTKYEGMSEAEIEDYLISLLKQKNNKRFITDVLNIHSNSKVDADPTKTIN